MSRGPFRGGVVRVAAQRGERGDEPRAFLDVMAAVERFCPWVSPSASASARAGPGPQPLLRGEARLASSLPPPSPRSPGGEVHVGIADGLFAGILAARTSLIVSKGRRPSSSRRGPCRPAPADLGVTLQRLGIHTLGQFAALPARHVFGRFGSDAVTCHRVARAGGGAGGVRDPGLARRLGCSGGPSEALPTGLLRGASAADTRAAASLTRLQRRLGTDAVVIGRVRGGRDPPSGPPSSPGARRRPTGQMPPGRHPGPGSCPRPPRRSSSPTPLPPRCVTPPGELGR